MNLPSSELDGRVIVIKPSGMFVEEQQYRDWLAEDSIFFQERGAKVAVCYGGQERISQELLDVGIEPEFDSSGLRIIKSKKAADAVTKAMDRLGHEVEDSFRKYTDRVHLYLRAVHAARYRYDFIGYPVKTDDSVKRTMNRGSIALVSPIGMGSDGHTHYNVNADDASGQVAVDTEADIYVNISRSPLVRVDGTTVYRLDEELIQDMLRNDEVSGGMKLKLNSCLKVYRAGTKAVYVFAWQDRNDLRNAIIS